MNEFNLETCTDYNKNCKKPVSWIAHESLTRRLFSNGVHKKLEFITRLKRLKSKVVKAIGTKGNPSDRLEKIKHIVRVNTVSVSV